MLAGSEAVIKLTAHKVAQLEDTKAGYVRTEFAAPPFKRSVTRTVVSPKSMRPAVVRLEKPTKVLVWSVN